MPIDLRQEFIDLIFGSFQDEAIGMKLLLRRLRRDPVTLARTKCSCVDPISLEPDRDTVCQFCLGEGYYWDEEWAYGYKVVTGSSTSLSRRIAYMQPGEILTETYRFFFDHSLNILPGDSIVELVLDSEGQIALPYRRLSKWKPTAIEEKRLVNGRIEFYIVTCQKDNSILIDKSNLSYVGNP